MEARQFVTHGVAALLGAAAALLAFGRHAGAPGARDVAGPGALEESTAVERRVRGLEAQHARDEATIARLETAVRERRPAAGAPLPTSPGGAPTPQQEVLREQELLNHVSAVHESQAPGQSTWGRALDSRVRHLMEEPAFASSALDRIDCRETLCRIEFRHDDDESAERFQGDLIEHGLSALGGDFVNRPHMDDDGVLRTTVLIAKPPHRLPMPPDQADRAPAVVVRLSDAP